MNCYGIHNFVGDRCTECGEERVDPMNEYIIELSLGGAQKVKVLAPDQDKAIELAQLFFIDDWENAGPLKLGDVFIDSVRPAADFVDPNAGIDASIVDKGESEWEYAKDDPEGRGEDE